MKFRNPTVTGTRQALLKSHPKKALKRESKRGPWQVFTPLEDLTRDQIIALPRAAFDEDEFYSLDEDDQEEILKNDPEAGPRIAALAELIESLEKHASEPDEDYLFESNAEYVHEEISNFNLDYFFRGPRTRYRYGKEEDTYDSIEEIANACGTDIENEAFQNAFRDVFLDSNNWNEELVDAYHSSTLVSWGPIHTDIYYEFGSNRDEVDLSAMSDEEIKIAMQEAGRSDYITAELLEKVRDSKYQTLQVESIETGYAVGADPDFEKMKDDMISFFEVPEGQADRPVLEVPEDRVVFRYPDGWYVQDLRPEELPGEGKEMRMCVGRDDMGYMDAVERGEIKILSMRDPRGKPKFTIEVALDKKGRPKAIAQIKGKANRLPGWNPGQTNQGNVRDDEVAKAVTAVEFLGLDPQKVLDLEPGYRAYRQLPKKNPGRGARSFDKPYRSI